MTSSRTSGRRRLVRLLVVLAVLAVVAPLAGAAVAHEEREVTQPGEGTFPEYRDTGPTAVVCKADSGQRIATLPAALRERNEALLQRCDFEHIQQAVEAIAGQGQPGYRILVLPGVYREEPSRESRETRFGAPIGQPELADECEPIWEATDGGGSALSYEEQLTCPHIQNLVAVHGDRTPGDDSVSCDSNLCDLQIEGTGARPGDVILDGAFGSGFLNGIHADRADGIYLKNLVAQHFEFNGVYVIETAGATADEVIGRYNHEYGFLSFQAWMRYENCDGHANGDSAVYPGASPDVMRTLGLLNHHRGEATFSTEVRGCRGHHNALGYSGTTGNSVWAHHNEWDHNATGVAMDSLFPDHPGTPQNHSLYEDNLYHENNVNYYTRYAQQGVCTEPLDERDYEDGAVCPAVPLPVGTGTILAGGNFNWFHRNRFFDNWRQGTFQFWVPAELREEEPVPDAHFREECGPDGDRTCPYEETSHWNTYSGNRLAEEPLHGFVQPNGADFAWDIEGEGNCWAQTETQFADPNTTAAEAITYKPLQDETASSNPVPFPDCSTRDQDFGSYTPLSTIAPEAGCVTYDAADNPDGDGCDWFEEPPLPEGRQPENATLERLDGADRIETAILASQEGYPTDAETVVLARHDLYPDALAGAPLAHARGGPLLLTPSDGLHADVAREIERLGASTVVLLGAEHALSSQVEADLRAVGFSPDDIVRLGGPTRYETAVEIARNLPATDALLAKGDAPDGQGWPDALAASPVAALVERPILLTAPDALPASVAAFLDAGDIEAVDVVGGEVAVSEEVAEEVRGRVDEVERIAGADRMETSLELAKWAVEAGADATELWLTTATNWPDGIAAGSAIAVDEGVMLLVGDEIGGDSAAASYLESFAPFQMSDDGDAKVRDVLERVRILGGTVAVPEAVATSLREDHGAQDGDAVGDRSHGNPTRHGAFDGATGAATVTETLVGSTRLRLTVSGLEADHSYEAHLVTGSCADPGAELTFPDGHGLEITFATDPAGTGVADETHYETSDDAPGAVVLHTHDGHDHGTICADL